jgi:hypothetical protein
MLFDRLGLRAQGLRLTRRTVGRVLHRIRSRVHRIDDDLGLLVLDGRTPLRKVGKLLLLLCGVLGLPGLFELLAHARHQ